VSRASSNPSNAGARRLDLTVVVPVYNNAATLAPLCDQLKAALGAAGISFELLFVNDGSRDDSAQQLAKLAKQHAEITVVPVFAGRRGRYPSPGRRLTSLMYRSLLRVLTGLPRDANIYVLMEPLLVQALVAFPTRHPSIAAMIGCLGVPTVSIPVQRTVRAQGRSSYTSSAVCARRSWAWPACSATACARRMKPICNAVKA
jgi:glycosyltransferase involved in cell wall biosynthesis